MEQLIILYIIWNLIALFIFGYDKYMAIKGGWRFSEKTFFLMSAALGALGILLGMKLFRHKTKHKSFIIGIPILLLINLVTIYYVYLVIL
jgi:uncharacterized membrane protein YsdA (DUF1294 family)